MNGVTTVKYPFGMGIEKHYWAGPRWARLEVVIRDYHANGERYARKLRSVRLAVGGTVRR